MGPDLRSMRSTLGELFVAPSTHPRLVSLVNNHRLFVHHDHTLTDGDGFVEWRNVVLCVVERFRYKFAALVDRAELLQYCSDDLPRQAT